MTASRSRRAARLGIALLVLAVIAAYADSLSGAFVFDDAPAILENPTLRPPFRLGAILAPPGAQAGSVGGRPILNLSLAFNYALGGVRVGGYHLFNLGVHVAAALLLFGIVRRTLRDALGRPDGESAALALASAALWALHPLQTEAVTYVVQRAESLMGMFYLLTLYAFIRSAPAVRSGGESPSRSFGLWSVLCLASCLLGMATKEVMVSAPLMVLLYDRTFAAGSFRAAWRRGRALYLGLGATWLLLAVLVIGTGGRGGSAGFGSAASVWPYLLTQSRAVLLYLRLALWPQPLVFDYGTALVRNLGGVLWQSAAVVLLLAGTVYAVVRRPAMGFLGAWFFAILAPSSSFVPIATEPVAEHRMYLPLAALAVLAVAALRSALIRLPPARAWAGFWIPIGLAAAALGCATSARNRVYRSPIALWTDTAAKVPDNPRARNDLGTALDAAGDKLRAEAEFTAAVRADPAYAPAQYNLGALLLESGRPAEALPHLEEALSAPRHRAELRLDLGDALARLGRLPEAREDDREAVRLKPASLVAVFQLGDHLAASGRYGEAANAFRRAVALAPQLMMPRNNLANALLFSGRVDEAIAEYRELLRLKPGDPTVRGNLDLALRIKAGRQGRH